MGSTVPRGIFPTPAVPPNAEARLGRDVAYAGFALVALGTPLAAAAIVAVMGEAGMMLGIGLLFATVFVTAVTVLISLACWREWPLLVLSLLAISMLKAWSEGLRGGYAVVPWVFAAAVIGFGGRWAWIRARQARSTPTPGGTTCDQSQGSWS